MIDVEERSLTVDRVTVEIDVAEVLNTEFSVRLADIAAVSAALDSWLAH